MTSVSFRRATESDLATIVDLLAADPLGQTRERVREAGDPVARCYADAFAAIERDDNQLLAVADDGGQVVGCLQLTFIPGLSRTGMWRGQIESVRVAPSHRQHGLGKRFIQWAIEQCRERNCGLVQLTSDKQRARAIAFYEALGFAASHEGLKLALERRTTASRPAARRPRP